jgi:hypothetical protein
MESSVNARRSDDMQRWTMTKRMWLLAVALAGAPAAFAQVDAQCMSQWNDAVATQAVGDACKVGDAASMAALKTAEDTALNCITSKMKPAEATDFRANAVKTKVAIAKQMATEPCPAQAKAYYQQRTQAPVQRSNR